MHSRKCGRKRKTHLSLRANNTLFQPFNAFAKMLQAFVQRLKLAVATSENAAPFRIINNFSRDKTIDNVMIQNLYCLLQ